MITTKDAYVVELAKLTPARIRAATFGELTELAAKIRRFLIESNAVTGGHIGANLGTIELSLALHKVFESPADKIIWDTGHQGYTHKIVTGRADRFRTLNTFGGMSRFITKAESEHDIIEASHGGTSISVALGIALAKALKGETESVVAVIGDGSLAEGLALEALNHASVATHANLVIVLNDNGYAISPGFGALHNYLQSLQPGSREPEQLFTALGYDYIGPIDGHDVEATVAALERAKESTQIPFVHVKTEKGHGWKAANGHPYRMHFSFPFDPDTGKGHEGFAYVGYQDIAAAVIGEAMERDDRIVAITPSTLYASGLQPVFKKFPDRSFDPGMEEQHAMTMTVGFALEGFKPVIVYQSTFMQRAFDQLVHDVCFAALPTLILCVRSGFAGYDNPTHHGIYDFAYWRGLPNLRVLYPKDRFELERMVRDELEGLARPTIIAMPYGPVDEIDAKVLGETRGAFRRPEIVQEGKDLTVIAVGHKFKVARDAAAQMRSKGIDCGLVNLRYLKPLPEEALAEILHRALRVVTIEEGVLDGGVGAAIAAFAADRRIKCEVLRLGVECAFIAPGSQDELCRLQELDVDGVLRRVRQFWKLDV
ncbi:MAG TPA: 1-deoxy-D-xylulose-5-phosphate synthase [Vicinamibacterales bacterium]|nr:1-deoxy-D-xylulose-5-phosphate synthase [Vicinamibacterales bacterium]